MTVNTEEKPISRAEYNTLLRRIERVENHISVVKMRLNIHFKSASASPRPNQACSHREIVLDCLDVHGGSEGMRSKEIQKITGLPFSSVAACLQALRKDGVIKSESGWPAYNREHIYYIPTKRP